MKLLGPTSMSSPSHGDAAQEVPERVREHKLQLIFSFTRLGDLYFPGLTRRRSSTPFNVAFITIVDARKRKEIALVWVEICSSNERELSNSPAKTDTPPERSDPNSVFSAVIEKLLNLCTGL